MIFTCKFISISAYVPIQSTLGNCLGSFILFSIGKVTPTPSILKTTIPLNSKKPRAFFQAGREEIKGASRKQYTTVATTQTTEKRFIYEY